MVYYFLAIFKQITLIEDLAETEQKLSALLIERVQEKFSNHKVHKLFYYSNKLFFVTLKYCFS